jgi:hypothetical protein
MPVPRLLRLKAKRAALYSRPCSSDRTGSRSTTRLAPLDPLSPANRFSDREGVSASYERVHANLLLTTPVSCRLRKPRSITRRGMCVSNTSAQCLRVSRYWPSG